MEISVKSEEEKGLKPFDINIRVETENDLKLLLAIFNSDFSIVKKSYENKFGNYPYCNRDMHYNCYVDLYKIAESKGIL